MRIQSSNAKLPAALPVAFAVSLLVAGISQPAQARITLDSLDARIAELEQADQGVGQLIVDAVVADAETTGSMVTVYGINFDNGVTPTVTLGGVALTNVVLVDANTITADLAQDYTYGSYNLTVETGANRTQFDAAMMSFAVEGPQGIQGPQGPTGEQGPQGPAGPDDQTLSLSGTSLSIENGNAVDLAVLFDDNDATNELNTGVSFDGTNLTVTDAGGALSADISALNDTAEQVLDKLITVDGSDSGLDADLLDGLHASEIIEAGGPERRTEISSIPYTITEPGSYVVIQNLTNSVASADGITIDADNVTLDLGGFTLDGNKDVVAGDDGILVSGDQDNIRIYNGNVTNWGGSGINAITADHSIFERLTVSSNGEDGLVADFSCVVSHVTASYNGFDGIECDDGSTIVFSTAQENGDNGIQTSEGSTVSHCAAFLNESDGIDVGSGSSVINSVVTDNLYYGVDLAIGGTIQGSVAYDNGGNGFDVASAALVRNNIAALNGSNSATISASSPEYYRNGIRTYANSWIIENQLHENDGSGIRVSSADTLVEGNLVTDNDEYGIISTSSGGLFLRNKAAGNITNYQLASNNAWGPIVNVAAAGDISLVANSDHPQANFEY